MTTLTQLIIDNPASTDAEIAGLFSAQSPTPKVPSDATRLTYVLIGTRKDLFGADAGNLAGLLHDGLAAWAAAPDISGLSPGLPNPGYLAILHTRLSGAVGLDMSDPSAPALLGLLTSGVNAEHPPLLTADQAAALLSIGYDVPTPIAESDVTAARTALALSTAKNGKMIAIEQWASYARAAVDAAETIDALPAVPGGAA